MREKQIKFTGVEEGIWKISYDLISLDCILEILQSGQMNKSYAQEQPKNTGIELK
jgi:hypothetical protein